MHRGTLVILAIVATGLAGFCVCELALSFRQKSAAFWTNDPYIPPQANADMATLMGTDARQYHWSAVDWKNILRMAESGVTPMIRAQAIYQIGDQAGCERCLAQARKDDAAMVLAKALVDPSEHVRAAAVKTCYACRYEEPKGAEADQSELVRYTWKMTYGRKP